MRKSVFLVSAILLLVGVGCASEVDPGTAATVTDDALAADAPLRVDVLALLNAARAAGTTCGGEALPPVPPLKEQSALVRAAANHAADMCERQYFGHDTPNGKSTFDRIKDAGYSYLNAGETIAAGQASAEAVVAEWLSSPGHCKNLMSANYTEVGTGHYLCGDQRGHYWTLNLGRPK